MGNVSHLVTRTAALQSSVENGLAEGMPAKDRQFVTALARGLDILRAFHAGEGMLGNQEIAHRTGLPKPTVARLTHTLTELGYLNYIRRFRKYELGQRMGEPRHGRLGQARAMGDFLVAQHAFAGMEGAQDVEAAGERGDELAILGGRALRQTVLSGALQGGGSRDEVADVAHMRFLRE